MDNLTTWYTLIYLALKHVEIFFSRFMLVNLLIDQDPVELQQMVDCNELNHL